jgi:hypothetical protein
LTWAPAETIFNERASRLRVIEAEQAAIAISSTSV